MLIVTGHWVDVTKETFIIAENDVLNVLQNSLSKLDRKIGMRDEPLDVWER